MIYITGDTHGDYSRFRTKGAKRMKKNDTLIVCGDFGFLWNGGKREKRLLKKIGKRKQNILFVDGVHENFKLLSQYSTEIWRGGKTKCISGNLRYLCRGQVFEIEKKRVFTFGGGAPESDDFLPKDFDVRDCIPMEEDFIEAVSNLKTCKNKVDYIVSYEPPMKIANFINLRKKEKDIANYLDEFSENVTFERWFFGKYHVNRVVTSKFYAIFNSVIKADSDKISKTGTKTPK